MIQYSNDSAQQINLQNLANPQQKVQTQQVEERVKQSNVQLSNCKICLTQIQDELVKKQANQQFISPCNCSGSIKYVHQSCLEEWLNSIVRKNMQNGQKTYTISCQICKTPYYYDIYFKYECSNYSQIAKKVQVHPKVLIVGIVCCIISLFGIAVTGYFTYDNKITLGKNKQPTNIVFVLASAFLGILIMVWVLSLTRIFLVKKIGYIKDIKSMEKLVQQYPIKISNNLGSG